MTVGLSAAGLVTPWLNTMRGGGSGTTFTAPATLFIQLHTGDPLASGTSAVSTAGSRQAVTFAPSAAGSQLALTGTTAWTNWAGTDGEIVTHISEWSAATSGTFYYSVQLTTPKTMNTGDTLTLTVLTFALTPQAA